MSRALARRLDRLVGRPSDLVPRLAHSLREKDYLLKKAGHSVDGFKLISHTGVRALDFMPKTLNAGRGF